MIFHVCCQVELRYCSGEFHSCANKDIEPLNGLPGQCGHDPKDGRKESHVEFATESVRAFATRAARVNLHNKKQDEHIGGKP